MTLKFKRQWCAAFPRLRHQWLKIYFSGPDCAEGALLLRKIVLSAAQCDRFWPRRCCKAREKLEEYHFASWGIMKEQTIDEQSSTILVTNFKAAAFLDPTACRLSAFWVAPNLFTCCFFFPYKFRWKIYKNFYSLNSLITKKKGQVLSVVGAWMY